MELWMMVVTGVTFLLSIYQWCEEGRSWFSFRRAGSWGAGGRRPNRPSSSVSWRYCDCAWRWKVYEVKLEIKRKRLKEGTWWKCDPKLYASSPDFFNISCLEWHFHKHQLFASYFLSDQLASPNEGEISAFKYVGSAGEPSMNFDYMPNNWRNLCSLISHN